MERGKIKKRGKKAGILKTLFAVFSVSTFEKLNMNSPKEHEHYESECESDLEKDDVEVLANRYESHVNKLTRPEAYINISKKRRDYNNRAKAHWTRMYDVIQEHFSSHVNINRASYMLPPNIYAMKHSSKQSWLLYKKRECERRKRLRLKMNEEKKKESLGCEPSNILLSLVDSCECCKKLYITVNLFWGITLCDICYFNSEVIAGIMKTKTRDALNPLGAIDSNQNKVIMGPKTSPEYLRAVASSARAASAKRGEYPSLAAKDFIPSSSPTISNPKDECYYTLNYPVTSNSKLSMDQKKSPPPPLPAPKEEEESNDFRVVSNYKPPASLTESKEWEENFSFVYDLLKEEEEEDEIAERGLELRYRDDTEGITGEDDLIDWDFVFPTSQQ